MSRSLFSALTVVLFALLSAPAFAQRSSAPIRATVDDGIILRTADGKQVVAPVGGKVSITYTGRMQRVPNEPNVRIVDSIESVCVSSGGATRVNVTGKIDVTINRSGTVVNSSGAGQPGNNDGANITVTGDNVTVNANGQNTSVNCTSGAQGTTINTGSGSSGSITYPGGGGYSGSVNYGSGSGIWSMGPTR